MTSHTGRNTATLARLVMPWLLASLATPALAAPALASAQPSLQPGMQPTPQHTPQPITHAPLPLMPMPAQVDVAPGHHRLSAGTALHYRDPAAATVSRQFADLLARTTGRQLTPSPAADAFAPPASRIDFALDPDAGIPAEGYRLTIDPERIAVVAGDPAGLYYGALTLWQLVEAAASGSGGDLDLPALRIEDAPRFGWRGYMLDSARHFHSVDQIKRVLDAMALHKLNLFHWHLTDDQGWRIEIKQHPRLAEVGGCRIPGGDAGLDPASGLPRPYCGHYSQEQIADIVAYAAQRHIQVLPEIDVPGHATAAIAAYPQLGVEGRPIPVSNQRGIHSNLFNVEEDTFAFLDEVFAEVAALFPAPWIHIGADEAVKDQWQASPRVQARMRELGIADEAALQGWFVRRLETILAGHGKKLVGWDEILEGGLPPQATVMSWRGTEGGLEAARQGRDVVMSPVSALYLDYLQTASPDEPAGRPKLNTLETFYAFEPVPAELEQSRHHHILGLQANMWTGDTRSFAGVEHNTWPRLAAVAETGWTPAAGKDYASFLQRLPDQLRRYRSLGIGHAHTPFQVVARADLLAGAGDSPQGEARVALSNPLGYPIRYTLDADADADADAKVDAHVDTDADTAQRRWPDYTGPLQRVKLPARLQAAAFADGRPLQPAQRFDLDRAALSSRDNKQLALCSNEGPVLRMEDDGPVDGPRALFDVAIFEPCWHWKQAPLDGVAGLEVRAGRLPYLIQLGAEDAKRRFLPAETAHGELDVRIDGCDGPRLASAPLPATPEADGFVTVHAALPAASDGLHDLCIRFSGDTRPAMWVLDRITLLPSPSPPTPTPKPTSE